MKLFKAAANFFGKVVERVGDVVGTVAKVVSNVANTAVDAVVNTAKTALEATFEVGQREVSSLVDKTVATISSAVEGAIDYVAKTADAIVGGSFRTIASAVETVADTVKNLGEIGGDLLRGRVELKDYTKLVTDIWQGTNETISNGWKVGNATVDLARDIATAANKGGYLALGDSNGLLGVNLFGSLLGGNTNQGVIPDARGVTGPVPFNVSVSGQTIGFGGELPITPLVTAVLAALPLTKTLVPVLAPLNLGGIGVVGKLDKEGINFKFYGIAGPSYNLGAAKVGGTLEVGTYNNLKLLSWNEKTVADLPIIGGILGKIPLIKDISFSLPKLDVHFDSKAYVQVQGEIDVQGKGPQGQIEVVTDLDHSLVLLAEIVGKIAGAALEGAGQVAGSVLDGTGKVVGSILVDPDPVSPDIQLIGSNAAPQELALAA